MLFRIGHGCALSHMESVDSVMPCRIAARIVNAAACHDSHVGAALNIKIIVYNIRHACGVHHHRNMHLFSLRFLTDVYVDSLLVRLPADLDVIRISMAEGLAVVPQVVCALLLKTVVIYFFQNSVRYRIQFHQYFLFSCRFQRHLFQDEILSDFICLPPGPCRHSSSPPGTASGESRPCFRSLPPFHPAPP